MPRRRSTRLARHGAASATAESAAVLLALPPEVMSLVALEVILGEEDDNLADVVRMLATCKAWRAVCSAEAFWRELCLAQYPRVRQILEHMPPPHPAWRQLYRRQRRAERSRRSIWLAYRGDLPLFLMPPHSHYLYTVEIYDDRGQGIPGPCQQPPLLSVSGRLEEYDPVDCLRLWDDGDEPSWAESLVRSWRESEYDLGQYNLGRWCISPGGRIAERLRITCFITRPDHASFCLYDDMIDRNHTQSTAGSVLDEWEGVDGEGSDIFELHFAKAILPRAGAAAYAPAHLAAANVQLILRLRSEGFHDSDEDPKYDPARGKLGNLPGVGELEVRYLHVDGDDSDDFSLREVRQYLESFAPFD